MKINSNPILCLKSLRPTLPTLLATAFIAGVAPASHAASWTSVYDPAQGGMVGVCGDIGTDAAGNVYATGRQVAPDGSSVAIVQSSADQGASWTVLDQFAGTGLSYAHHRAFAADPACVGHLFAGGNLNGVLP